MTPSSIALSIRRHLLVGVSMLAIVGGAMGTWAAGTELSDAIIAPGKLVVYSFVKKVQHESGGVVREIRVKDGDFVKAGDILIRLDDTIPKANLALITDELDELAAARARAEAERDGATSIRFPDELLRRAREPKVAVLLPGVIKQFESGLAARAGQRAQLNAQIDQLGQQMQGVTKEADAKTREIQLLQNELAGLRGLYSKHYIQLNQVTTMERDNVLAEGAAGQLIAKIGEIGSKIAETKIQILQIDRDLRKEDEKQIEQNRARTSELLEREIAAREQLSRVDIRSPQSGRVHELSVHTVGGVIVAQADPIMLIVPDQDKLEVEARIMPQDIDQLRPGEKVVVRLPGLSQQGTPELNGVLTSISADTIIDPKTGASFYVVRAELNEAGFAKLGNVKLVPGMPAEIFIETHAPRTILSYLIKPIHDQAVKAFR